MELTNEENTSYIRDLRRKLFDCRCEVGVLECIEDLTPEHDEVLDEVWMHVYDAMKLLGDIIDDDEYN